MNKRPFIYLPIFFALVLILGIFLGTLLIPAFNSKNGIFSFDFENNDKIQAILSYVENNYVDSVSNEDLVNFTINGLLQQLDPHSAYIPAEDFNEANDPLKGNFDGIGIQFRIIHDSLTVISLIPGGPSELEGLLPGDRIVTVDSKKVAGVKISNDEAIRLLKGPSGTRVSVGVYRKSARRNLSFNITRGNIATSSIDISYMVTRDIGYIKISRFASNTTEEFIAAGNELAARGMKKLILDLRGNGGGVMTTAVELADQFLTQNKLIVYTEGYHQKKQVFHSEKTGNFEQTALAILVDELSASASEILAGAIQDNDRGVIIGRRTFGKGLVLEQIRLPDSSALRLTIARFYTPTGRCIQKPYTADYQKYYADFYKQFLTDEEYQDSLNFVDTLRFTTPGGKVVYGGGGIMPDFYIPAKSAFSSDYYKKLLNGGIIADFAFEYTDRNRPALEKFKSAEGFLSGFQVSPALLEELIVYAEKNGVKRNMADLKTSDKILKAELKGQIGLLVYNDAAYFPVVLPEDKVFQKAIGFFGEGK